MKKKPAVSKPELEEFRKALDAMQPDVIDSLGGHLDELRDFPDDFGTEFIGEKILRGVPKVVIARLRKVAEERDDALYSIQQIVGALSRVCDQVSDEKWNEEEQELPKCKCCGATLLNVPRKKVRR